MNGLRLLQRRAAFTLSHIPKVQQARNISGLHPTGLLTSRQAYQKTCEQVIRPRTFFTKHPGLRNAGRLRNNSTKPSPNPTSNLGSPEPAPSLSQRLKKLSREYGWTAVGVYLLLSALDFPFCFLAVRALGTERIGQWEHAVVEFVKSIISIPFPGMVKDTGEGRVDAGEYAQSAIREGSITLDTELSEAEAAISESDASRSSSRVRFASY
jgi:hypothetical protein